MCSSIIMHTTLIHSTGDANKKYPTKEFCQFLTIIDLLHKIYTLVMQSNIHKPWKFYYIIYRTDKTALLLIVPT